jgi:hypothetical protein
MSTSNVWQERLEDEVEIDLENGSPTPYRSFFAKCLSWLYDSRSTIIVLWVLLMSEAVRGITIPTQSNFVKFVRSNHILQWFLFVFSCYHHDRLHFFL